MQSAYEIAAGVRTGTLSPLAILEQTLGAHHSYRAAGGGLG